MIRSKLYISTKEKRYPSILIKYVNHHTIRVLVVASLLLLLLVLAAYLVDCCLISEVWLMGYRPGLVPL